MAQPVGFRISPASSPARQQAVVRARFYRVTAPPVWGPHGMIHTVQPLTVREPHTRPCGGGGGLHGGSQTRPPVPSGGSHGGTSQYGPRGVSGRLRHCRSHCFHRSSQERSRSRKERKCCSHADGGPGGADFFSNPAGTAGPACAITAAASQPARDTMHFQFMALCLPVPAKPRVSHPTRGPGTRFARGGPNCASCQFKHLTRLFVAVAHPPGTRMVHQGA
jgi:hypothetical protein